MLAVLCLFGGASREAAAQLLAQDGPKLVGSGVNGAIADQGASVAVSADGNTAIVGGPFDGGANGAAWVFIQNNGAWTQQQKLVASNGAGSNQATSVALSADGNTAIVGGPDANSDNGAAWVYTRTNGVWTEQQMLTGSGIIGSQARQGTSVALSGDGNTAIVGGPTDNFDLNTANAIGAAWVFTQSNGVWTQQQKLVGSGVIGGNAHQGTSVALSANGSTAIVGGPLDNFDPNSAPTNRGAAWVFTQSNGTWTQQQKLVATQTYNGQEGTSVALSADGSTAIVGAPLQTFPGSGAAWVFTQSNGSWTVQQELIGSESAGSNKAPRSRCRPTAAPRSWAGRTCTPTERRGSYPKQRQLDRQRTAGRHAALRGATRSQASQGTSVALSADGSTAIVGRPTDNVQWHLRINRSGVGLFHSGGDRDRAERRPGGGRHRRDDYRQQLRLHDRGAFRRELRALLHGEQRGLDRDDRAGRQRHGRCDGDRRRRHDSDQRGRSVHLSSPGGDHDRAVERPGGGRHPRDHHRGELQRRVRRAVRRGLRARVHGEQRNLDHGDRAGRQRHGGCDGDGRWLHQRYQRRRSVHLRRRAGGDLGGAEQRLCGRRHRRDHHRRRLHRRDRGEFRWQCGGLLQCRQRDLDHGDVAGRQRHRRCDGDNECWNERDRRRRWFYLHCHADGDRGVAEQRTEQRWDQCDDHR